LQYKLALALVTEHHIAAPQGWSYIIVPLAVVVWLLSFKPALSRRWIQPDWSNLHWVVQGYLCVGIVMSVSQTGWAQHGTYFSGCANVGKEGANEQL